MKLQTAGATSTSPHAAWDLRHLTWRHPQQRGCHSGCHGCKVSQRNCYHFTMCHQTPKYGHQNRLKLDLTWFRPPKNPVKWVKTQKNGPKSWLDPSWPDFFYQTRLCAYTLIGIIIFLNLKSLFFFVNFNSCVLSILWLMSLFFSCRPWPPFFIAANVFPYQILQRWPLIYDCRKVPP